jgi:hypothetical protein
MAAEDEDSLNAKTNLRQAYPHLQTQVLWATWIDIQSLTFEETDFVPAAVIANEGKTRPEPNEQQQQ